jgi:hypothetical protein
METLLAKVALQFAPGRTEVLATEALGHILRRSADARRAVIGLAPFGPDARPGDLDFENELTGEEGTRPDLTGLDEHRAKRMIVEGKFWAPLTDHQPATYLESLAGGGALVFVAPERRMSVLWREILRASEEAGFAVSEEQTQAASRTATVEDKGYLQIISWRTLLDSMTSAADSAGQAAVGCDIQQLRGLAEREDAEAFLPLSRDELSPSVARWILQFNHVLKEVADKFGGERLEPWQHGSYLNIGGGAACLALDFHLWGSGDREDTPFWLVLDSYDNVAALRAGDWAVHLEPTWRNKPACPLRVKCGVERNILIESLVNQVDDILKSR